MSNNDNEFNYPTLAINEMQYHPKLRFGPCQIEIDLTTGEVTIPEGLSLSDAARAFWEIVSEMHRGFGR